MKEETEVGRDKSMAIVFFKYFLSIENSNMS